jgi:hypothetical protein
VLSPSKRCPGVARAFRANRKIFFPPIAIIMMVLTIIHDSAAASVLGGLHHEYSLAPAGV